VTILLVGCYWNPCGGGFPLALRLYAPWRSLRRPRPQGSRVAAPPETKASTSFIDAVAELGAGQAGVRTWRLERGTSRVRLRMQGPV